MIILIFTLENKVCYHWTDTFQKFAFSEVPSFYFGCKPPFARMKRFFANVLVKIVMLL